jgi:beta-lactam-binding protein with PASTA domain
MTLKKFFSFRKNRLFWGNLIAMAVVVALLIYGVLAGLDSYTRHGEAVVVPSVRDKSVAEANRILAGRRLIGIVSDSTYVKTKPAGYVLECTPAAGQKVKEGRTIYLTVNTLNVPKQVVPDVSDNSSMRQAQARLAAAGFRLDEIEYIAGEKDWVYGVKYNGVMLTGAEQVPTGATLTLVVGNGERSAESDSLNIDKPAAPEEDWF